MTHPLNESSDELQISRKKLNTRNYVIADLRFVLETTGQLIVDTLFVLKR